MNFPSQFLLCTIIKKYSASIDFYISRNEWTCIFKAILRLLYLSSCNVNFIRSIIATMYHNRTRSFGWEKKAHNPTPWDFWIKNCKSVENLLKRHLHCLPKFCHTSENDLDRPWLAIYVSLFRYVRIYAFLLPSLYTRIPIFIASFLR